MQQLRTVCTPLTIAPCRRKNNFVVVAFNDYTLDLKWVIFFFCRYLSPFSIIANIIQSIGLGIIFFYIFGSELKPSDSLPWFGSADRLPLFFGTAIFAIEGISVVLPIENQMRYPKDMLGYNGVLNTSMALVVALYIAMGFYGYLKYGEEIAATITLNLPPGDM